MTSTQRKILRAAAERPGIRLLHAVKRVKRSYATVKREAAKLRQRQLLYSGRPAWIILVPSWKHRMCTFLSERQQPSIGRAAWMIIDMALDGPIPQPEAVKAVGGNAQNAIEALRDHRVLHPWDGLVLTDQGVSLLRERGIKVRQQIWSEA